MTEKLNAGGLPAIRRKYTPTFKAECVRQVAAGARQSDVARAQGISPALLGRWQRQTLEAAVPSSAERDEIRQLHAALKRVEMERDILKKPWPSFPNRLSHEPLRLYCGLRRALARAGLVPGAGRELGRLLPVAATTCPRLRRGRQRRRMPSRATPGATAPVGCGPNCRSKATRWGVTPCAPSCTARACAP